MPERPIDFSAARVGDRVRFVTATNGFDNGQGEVWRTGIITSITDRAARVACDPNTLSPTATLRRTGWKARAVSRFGPEQPPVTDVLDFIRLRAEAASPVPNLGPGVADTDVQFIASARSWVLELADTVTILTNRLTAFEALELGDIDGRVSAACPDPAHPTWIRAQEDTRGCPWCRIAELEDERHTTNEWVDDAAEALRANRDRINELEADKPTADPTPGQVSYLIEVIRDAARAAANRQNSPETAAAWALISTGLVDRRALAVIAAPAAPAPNDAAESAPAYDGGLMPDELELIQPGTYQCTCTHWDNVHGSVCFVSGCDCRDFTYTTTGSTL